MSELSPAPRLTTAQRRQDVWLAAGLLVAAVLSAWLGSTASVYGTESAPFSWALAYAVALTVPIAFRRRVPIVVLVVIAVAFFTGVSLRIPEVYVGTVTLFIEGEVEVASDSRPALLRTYADELTSDVLVLADSANWAVGTPALTTTLRGTVRAVVTVRTLAHSVHSGMFGGAVPDSLTTLCRLLATLHDDAGSVAVAGLDSDENVDIDYTPEELRRDAGMLEGTQLIGTGPLTARLWRGPSITVIGLDATGVDVASNTLAASSRAKLSLRVAPGQDPQAAYEALAEHLRSHAPWGAQVEVELEEIGSGFDADATGPLYDEARAAFRDAWGSDPVDVGIGGSIPFVSLFAEMMPNAALLVTGVEDPDTRAHGANESLHLGEFAKVCLAEAVLLQRVAKASDGA